MGYMCLHLTFQLLRTQRQRSKENANADVTCDDSLIWEATVQQSDRKSEVLLHDNNEVQPFPTIKKRLHSKRSECQFFNDTDNEKINVLNAVKTCLLQPVSGPYIQEVVIQREKPLKTFQFLKPKN